MKSFLFLSILSIGTSLVHANNYPNLIRPTSIQTMPEKVISRDLLGMNHAVSTQEIEVDTNTLFYSDIVSFTIGSENFIADRISVIKNETKDYIYCAYEAEDVEISISKLGNNVQGIINGASFGSYIIETIEDSYILAELDSDGVEQDCPSVEYHDDNMSLFETIENVSSSITSSDIKYLRVLVMYTPEALSLVSNMTNKVYQEINNGNTSFQNSGVNVRFELAYVGQTEDSEGSYTFSQLLYNFTGNGDGFADEVHTLRERYAADVCVLLVAMSGYCGKAWVNSNKSSAFAVVKASSYCASKYSFTHEIGHNAGCLHDTLVSPTTNPYQYGHGYVHYTGTTGTSWRTMMAYGDACGGESYCQRIKYWSNPNIDYNGSPTGDATWSNNAMVWNGNATKISSFNTDPSSITITNADNNTYMDYACWRATQDISASNYSIESGQIVEMLASSSITLLPGTTIKASATFRAAIASQSPNANYPQFTPKHPNPIEPSNDINLIVKMSDNNLNLELLLEKDCQNVTIRIFDVLGHLQQVILSNRKLQMGEHSFNTNVDNLSNGVYLLVTQIDDKNNINKFTK